MYFLAKLVFNSYVCLFEYCFTESTQNFTKPLSTKNISYVLYNYFMALKPIHCKTKSRNGNVIIHNEAFMFKFKSHVSTFLKL